MEITKREILFSIIIVLFMLLFGLFISNSITDGIVENNENCYKAVKITDKEQFQYGLKTAIGNALVYGEVKSKEPVSVSDLSGEYFRIEKVKERYTRKTRTVTTKDSKGKQRTKIETYYEWDRVGSEDFGSKQFEFMGVAFENPLSGVPKTKADLSSIATDVNNVRWNYLYENGRFFESVGDVRYYFYVSPASFNATIEAKIGKNEIANFDGNETIYVHHNIKIQDLMKNLEGKEQAAIITFWVVWILITAGAVVGFCFIENRWLED